MPHGYGEDLQQIQISISAYDADKAWVKALIKKVDWLCRVEKESAAFHQMEVWNIMDY